MLLRCCLTYKTIIILRQILYFVYLCLYLGLGLFISYLSDLNLIYIVIDHITSLKQTHLVFAQFLKYLLLFLDGKVNEESG